MSRLCKNVKEWIEEEIEETIREEERRRQRRCRNRRRWWQRLFCWFVWVLLVVFRVIIVTVGKWVITLVCYTIAGLLNTVSAIVNFIFGIPVIGSFLKQVYELTKGTFLRVNKLLVEIVGFWIPKKINIIILVMNGDKGLATQSHIDDCVDKTRQVLKDECNIRLKVLEIKFYEKNTPSELKLIDCDDTLSYSFGDKLLQLTKLMINDFYDDNFATLTGIGQSIYVVYTAFEENECDGVMHNVLANNFIFIDTNCNVNTMTHEIGHLCGLIFPDFGHVDDRDNLMHATSNPTNPIVTNYQRTMFRTSRYCHFI